MNMQGFKYIVSILVLALVLGSSCKKKPEPLFILNGVELYPNSASKTNSLSQ